jgi:indole-3-glycerol phosphate synthase
LLRREVELLVERTHGAECSREQQVRTELAGINRDLNKLKKQIAALEARKSKLLPEPGK